MGLLIIILNTLILVVSCATGKLKSPKKLYRNNMELIVNGEKSIGVHVARPAQTYSIEVRFKKKMDNLKINTCHRYIVKNDVGRNWKYIYKKAEGIEDNGMCTMHIGGFNFGAYSWGLIEFKNDSDVNLMANMRCNGVLSRVNGVSICQAQKGLRQSITFGVETKAYAQDECDKPFTYDNYTHYYDINRGNCVYIFKAGKRFHRHRTYGFDDEL